MKAPFTERKLIEMKKLVPVLFMGLALVGLLMILNACNSAGKDAALSPTTGQGGSMARFAITGNTLYIVSNTALDVYDISKPAEPAKKATQQLGFGIETIFPYQNHLYIGAVNGMYILDATTPTNPQTISTFWHVQSCDPVVVQGNYAYVTLRGGATCRPGNTLSTLDVVDITNPSQPKQVFAAPMLSPYGLGISGNRLFVCEGDNGLKVFDVTDPIKPVEKQHLKDLQSYDVIVRQNHLIVTGSKGLSQYAFDANEKFELLSTIPVL